MRPVLIIYTILICTQHSNCQTVSKAEILNEFRKHRTIPKLDSIFYDEYHSGARETFDKLRKDDVDTLVVFLFDHPGHSLLIKNDTCSDIRNSYFFWKHQGEYRLSADSKHCVLLSGASSKRIVNFATDNFSRIRDEFFMEAVFGAERKGDNIKIAESWVDHEPKYALLVVVNGSYNYLEFTNNGLTNKRSLFLDYNRALMTYELFRLIEEERKGGR